VVFHLVFELRPAALGAANAAAIVVLGLDLLLAVASDIDSAALYCVAPAPASNAPVTCRNAIEMSAFSPH